MKQSDVLVSLTQMELWTAAMCGAWRRTVSIKNGNNANIHAKQSDWTTDIDGAAAEMAAAKALGVFWSPTVNTFKEPDLGCNIQVRSTRHHDGHLIVRKNDSDADIFLLMVGYGLDWRMAGWAYGRESKVEGFWRPENKGGVGCWFVPQDALRAANALIHRNDSGRPVERPE